LVGQAGLAHSLTAVVAGVRRAAIDDAGFAENIALLHPACRN